jgi:hypothetical protein
MQKGNSEACKLISRVIQSYSEETRKQEVVFLVNEAKKEQLNSALKVKH